MLGHWIDVVSLGYLCIGYLRGLKRGLGTELYKAINWAIPFFTGCGLYRWVSDVLGTLPFLSSGNAGVMGFIITMGGTFVLLRIVRVRLRAWLEGRFSESKKRAGGMAGLARTGFVVSSLAMILSLAPVSLMGSSYVGKVVSIFLPSEDAETPPEKEAPRIQIGE